MSINIGDYIRVDIDNEWLRSGWQDMEGIVTGFYKSWHDDQPLVQFKVTKEAPGGSSSRKVGDVVNDMGLRQTKIKVLSSKFKVGDRVKYIDPLYFNSYNPYTYEIVEFVDAGEGLYHARCAIIKNGRRAGLIHTHAQKELTLAQHQVSEGDEISLKDIKEGQTIRVSGTRHGIKIVRESVVGATSEYGIYSQDGSRIDHTGVQWKYVLVKDAPEKGPKRETLSKIAALPGHQVVWQRGNGHFVQTGKKTGGEWTWLHIKPRSEAAVVVTNKEVAEALEAGAEILK